MLFATSVSTRNPPLVPCLTTRPGLKFGHRRNLHLDALLADVQRVGGELCQRPRSQPAEELLEPGSRARILWMPARRYVSFPLRRSVTVVSSEADYNITA